MKNITRAFKIMVVSVRASILSIVCMLCIFVSTVSAEVAVQAPKLPAQQNTSLPDATTTPVAPTQADTIKTTESSEKKTSSASQLANLLGGLGLILVLIYGLSWFMKRFKHGGFMQNSTIKMLASMSLGARERLMLVDVGGKQILLGITASSINSLHVFDSPVIISGAEATSKNTSDFSQKLMALLQQKNMTASDSTTPKNINP
jgi:flagellar protein FliO/FliZ